MPAGMLFIKRNENRAWSQVIYNIAENTACFSITRNILVTPDTEKQTLLLAGYKHATIL